jgi:hypothetical protein
MGSMYTIAWPLPVIPEGRIPSVVEAESLVFRGLLLEFRESQLRRDPAVSDTMTAVQRVFERLHALVTSKFPSIDPAERIDVTLMTYDSNRRLVIVGGTLNGGSLPQPYWDLYLPPGLGNGGVCLKTGRGVFYVRDARNEFSHYVRALDGHEHAILLSLPLDHPDLEQRVPEETADFELVRSSQLVGVMNIGSTSAASGLFRLQFQSEAVDELRALSQFALNQLWPVFVRSPNAGAGG